MKRISGRLLELLLLICCFSMFILVLPDWIGIMLAGAILIVCLVSMISSNFFGRF
ncbi:MAG: hypothetical protein GX061_06745 [Eubacteriaceae bacterium]|nr:hypothetical protein [Eubacteriaceae bacterium]